MTEPVKGANDYVVQQGSSHTTYFIPPPPIEITDEMVEAGVSALSRYIHGGAPHWLKQIVRAILTAALGRR